MRVKQDPVPPEPDWLEFIERRLVIYAGCAADIRRLVREVKKLRARVPE